MRDSGSLAFLKIYINRARFINELFLCPKCFALCISNLTGFKNRNNLVLNML